MRATADDVAAMPLVCERGLETRVLTEGGQGLQAAIFSAVSVRGTGRRSKVLGFTGAEGSNSLMSPSSLGWPTLAYPTSASEEASILENVRASLQANSEAGTPCAAIVIEPTAALTGHTASSDFVAQLRAISNEFEAALIIDETNTCLASGAGIF